MKKIARLLLVCLIILNTYIPVTLSATTTESDTTSKDDVASECMGVFPDVKSDNIFCPYIEFLYHQKVINGAPDGKFYPDSPVDRGAVSKFIVNAFLIEEETTGVDFPDVPKNSTFYKYIKTLKNSSIITGYSDGLYKPEEKVTRGAFMKYLVNSAELKNEGLFQNSCMCQTITLADGSKILACPKCAEITDYFTDVDHDSQFFEYIIPAYYATKDKNAFVKIIGGFSDGSFKPEMEISRGGLAKIIANTMKFAGAKTVDCERYFCQDKFTGPAKTDTATENQTSSGTTIVSKDIEIIRDFSSVSEANISDIEVFDKTLYIVDKGNGEVLSLDYQGDSLDTVLDGIDKPDAITFSDSGRLLFTSENADKSVSSYDIFDAKRIDYPITKAMLGDVRNIEWYKVNDSDVRLYGSRLGAEDLIFMYDKTTSLDVPRVRINIDAHPNFSDFDVEQGIIYTISEGFGLRRFFGIHEYTSPVEGLTGDLKTVNSIYAKNSSVYLGDPASESVLILKQNTDVASPLVFEKKIDLSKIENADKIHEIIADQDANLLFVLAGKKIIKVQL